MERNLYLEKIIRKRNNGMIKVITGIRRCGKTYLLFELFYDYLLKSGVDQGHIIKIALDDRVNKKYRDPDVLCEYVHGAVKDERMHYVLLDEVQMVPEFEDVLNSFLHMKNVDTYVTGSNAKFLSKDIITEFAGRGDEIHVLPLTFSEFYSVFNGTKEEAFDEYMVYGGLPAVALMNTDEQKIKYLQTQISNVYLRDIVLRHNLASDRDLGELIDILASGISSLTNPSKLADTFRSVKKASLSAVTIDKYIDYMEEAFILSKVKRYDVKGKKYIGTK